MWKIFLRARESSRGLINKNIANGRSTRVWFDPCPHGERLGWQYMSNVGGSNKEVFALMSDSKWCLNNSNLPPNICNTIENISIDKNSNEDYR